MLLRMTVINLGRWHNSPHERLVADSKKTIGSGRPSHTQHINPHARPGVAILL